MFKNPAENIGLIESTKEPTIFTETHDSLVRTAYNMFLDKTNIGTWSKNV